MSDSRRKRLVSILKESISPVTGTMLAEQLNVSRQVIVQDIAVLRAQGVQITASSSGYTIQSTEATHQLIKTLVSNHVGVDQMAEELKIIIEYGGKIRDVIVEHPVYGEIVGNLFLSTLADVEAFMEKVKTTNAKPLATLTEGEHIHTIEVPSEKLYNLMLRELKEKGYVK